MNVNIAQMNRLMARQNELLEEMSGQSYRRLEAILEVLKEKEGSVGLENLKDL